MKLQHLPLEVVDALCRVTPRRGEHVALEVADRLVEPVDDRDVVVDDAVDDRVQDRPGAGPQQIRALLRLQPDLVERCLAVPHSDHEARADEQEDLAELDDVVALGEPCGLEDDEERVAVDLELRPLVRLDASPRQLVQVELTPADSNSGRSG